MQWNLSTTKPIRRAATLVALVMAMAAPVPVGAVMSPADGPTLDGWVRLVKYAGCAFSAYVAVSTGSTFVGSQALAFCAQILSEESG